MNFQTPSFKEASGTTKIYRKGVNAKFSTIEHNANSLLSLSQLGSSFSPLLYERCWLCDKWDWAFLVKTLPAKRTTSTRRQVVEIALISGYLVSMDFHKNNRQTKHNVANTAVSNT